MFDDIEAGRVAEQPAREDAAPLRFGTGLRALLYQHLHKGAGLCPRLPRGGLLAGGQAQDHVTQPPAFAGLQFHVLRDVVAFVEQADGGDALRHGRADRVRLRPSRRSGRRGEFARDGGALRLRLRLAVGTGGQQQWQGHRPCGETDCHRCAFTAGAFQASGDQAS
ncbi:hypothetical protein PK98_06150 [Croceibacterium mercuriale]|uniref:Uncharacterized protein n=1 Tax=Croceibacterium mercuriale TaxID=1572751 RepID=A0A0B2BWV5_9SPHN|nr:hypothetical protein PK98_06150 [Croceibacterium mercuriale]